MLTDSDVSDLISSDLRELRNAGKKLATHVVKLSAVGFGATFLQWIASFAAMYVSLSHTTLFLLHLAMLLFVVRC